MRSRILHKLYWILIWHWVLMRQPATQAGHTHQHNPSRNSLDDSGRVPYKGGRPVSLQAVQQVSMQLSSSQDP